MTKSEIELALDVRSDERVVLITMPKPVTYPEHWETPQSPEELSLSVAQDCVVIIDSTNVSRRTIAAIGELRPRLLAVVTIDDEHARHIRKSITALYPWAEFWMIATNLGRALVTKDVVGAAYDRDAVIDMRGNAFA